MTTAEPGTRAGGPAWKTVGHVAALRLLQRSHAAGRVAHAYLVTGPDQVGRRTLALDLARLVNCTPAPDLFGDDPEPPCGRCLHCDRIEKGIYADVSVIEPHTPIRGAAAGTTESTPEQDARRTVISINHVREVQHDIALNPFEGRRRVVIFDGAEHMNPDGWNSLLKSLEEPPGHAIIVLVATSASALPETVISRCQLIELHAVPADVIERRLLEDGRVDAESAAQLARLAGGRPGRAFAALGDETALDRYRQAVLRVLTISAADVEERLRYARDMAAEFGRARESVIRELELWSSVWHDLLLLGHGLEQAISNVAWKAQLVEIAPALEPGDPKRALEALESAVRGLRRNGLPRLVLDVLMLDLPGIPADVAEKVVPGGNDDGADGWDETGS